MTAPAGDTWIDLLGDRLPTAEAMEWATRSGSGAVVTFSGTARDHSEGRGGVDLLTYEAYETAALDRLSVVADAVRSRWPDVVAVALLHRLGEVPIGEEAVVVVVSAPHRDSAFGAGRFAIDTLKATVPIWKRERWAGGESWGLEAQHLVTVDEADGPQVARVNALGFLGLAVGSSVVGTTIVAIRHRPRRSPNQSIDDFADHLRALAPDPVVPRHVTPSADRSEAPDAPDGDR